MINQSWLMKSKRLANETMKLVNKHSNIKNNFEQSPKLVNTNYKIG